MTGVQADREFTKVRSLLCQLFLMVCLAISFSGFCTKGYAQETELGFKRYARWMVQDPVHMVTNIRGDDLLRAGFVGTSIASISMTDKTTYQLIHSENGNSRFLNVANGLGDKKFAFTASAGLFGISMLTDDQKFQDAAFTSLQSLIMTNMTIGAGKFLFARARPGARTGAFDFDFARLGQTSFPSGHTSTAFALVTPWVVYYPNAFTYSLMALPAATGIARVYKGKHWLSDVTAGAVIGFSMGYYLSRKHLNMGNKSLHVIPRFGKKQVGLSVSLNF